VAEKVLWPLLQGGADSAKGDALSEIFPVSESPFKQTPTVKPHKSHSSRSETI